MSRSGATNVADRFWAKVSPTGFCWEWKASIKPNGYGQFGVASGRVVYAHRYAYELLVGPISEGADIDHLCRNRACVNPDHLDPVDRRTNLLRSPITLPGSAARRGACRRGHPWTPDNTRFESGHRICRSCRNASKRVAYQMRSAS
ncbi:HNH endonuclease [Streptomyces sp. DW26H14]|uniref:HNH endonuclease n=1 Tax=Streptomyces sp. DW26H14 TaxID=3435395 RepID=UPI00403D6524